MKKQILFLAVLISLFGVAEAFSKESSELGQITGVLPQQIGADRLNLTIEGKRLPRPELLEETAEFMDFFFKGTVISAARWERDYHLPLASKIEMDHVKGGLSLRLSTEARLVLMGIKGENDSGRIVLEFKTWTDTKRAETERKVLAPKPIPVDPSDPFQTQKKITVDFRDASLQDVFRALSDMLKLNVVMDPSVANVPLITLRFENAPIKEVFGYLMKLYDLTYAKVGKTIIVGSPMSVAKTVGDEKTRTFQVAYSDVKAIPDMLGNLTTVPKDKITVDERLGRIYVKASEKQLSDIEKILQAVDHPGQQVMLRARIIEIKEDATDELETILNAVYNHWWFGSSSAGAAGGYSYLNNPEAYTPGTGDSRPGGIELPGVSIADVGSTGGIKLLDTGLKALVTNNKGKLLADPSVITVSGKKASIKLVEKLKYISERDDAGNPTYSDEEVGPQLEFTPIVGRDGLVSIELSISTGEVIAWKEGNQGEKVPQTSEREVVTYVRVRDGEPFVIGGLFNERHSVNTTKIPVLGDIPLLGELFKSKTKTDDRTEVVMVVIPYILDIRDAPVDHWDI